MTATARRLCRQGRAKSGGNTPDIIDFEESAKCISASAEILEFLANTENVTPYRTIPEEQKQAIDAQFNAVYGGF